jgi:hypothetical protein
MYKTKSGPASGAKPVWRMWNEEGGREDADGRAKGPVGARGNDYPPVVLQKGGGSDPGLGPLRLCSVSLPFGGAPSSLGTGSKHHWRRGVDFLSLVTLGNI